MIAGRSTRRSRAALTANARRDQLRLKPCQIRLKIRPLLPHLPRLAPAGIQALEVEDVVDETAEAVAVVDRHREEFLLLGVDLAEQSRVEHLKAALD